jgi:hypothetical protein
LIEASLENSSIPIKLPHTSTVNFITRKNLLKNEKSSIFPPRFHRQHPLSPRVDPDSSQQSNFINLKSFIHPEDKKGTLLMGE